MLFALCLFTTPTWIVCLPHQYKIAWPRYGRGVGVNYFSQRHTDTLPCSGIEPRVNNFAVANLRSYLLSCTPSVGMLELNVFPKDKNKQRSRLSDSNLKNCLLLLATNRNPRCNLYGENKAES